MYLDGLNLLNFYTKEEKLLGTFCVESGVWRPHRGFGWTSSHLGTLIQVRETDIKVATRMSDRRWTDVTPCSLLETKALCEVLNLW